MTSARAFVALGSNLGNVSGPWFVWVDDVDAIADIIVKVSQLVEENPEIREMDLNPVLVYRRGLGAKVVDARMIIGCGPRRFKIPMFAS